MRAYIPFQSRFPLPPVTKNFEMALQNGRTRVHKSSEWLKESLKEMKEEEGKRRIEVASLVLYSSIFFIYVCLIVCFCSLKKKKTLREKENRTKNKNNREDAHFFPDPGLQITARKWSTKNGTNEAFVVVIENQWFDCLHRYSGSKSVRFLVTFFSFFYYYESICKSLMVGCVVFDFWILILFHLTLYKISRGTEMC